MYQKILITLDTTPTDRAIIEHIKPLAAMLHSRVVLLHVATGVRAQYQGLGSEGQEVGQGQRYLEQVRDEFQAAGVPAETCLAYGEPAREIINWVKSQGCDLVAMSTHGHQFMADLVLGTTAINVQHHLSVPVLLLRAK